MTEKFPTQDHRECTACSHLHLPSDPAPAHAGEFDLDIAELLIRQSLLAQMKPAPYRSALMAALETWHDIDEQVQHLSRNLAQVLELIVSESRI